MLAKKFISLKDIPKELYKGMILLNKNKGETSFVFDKKDGNVRIFTTDAIKSDYLTTYFGLALGDYIDTLDLSAFKKHDIWIIDMPMLVPLNAHNRKLANELIKCIKNTRGRNTYSHLTNALEYAYSNKKPKEVLTILENLENFSGLYGEFDLVVDISIRQFMQTKDGELILLDPFVMKKLLKQLVYARLINQMVYSAVYPYFNTKTTGMSYYDNFLGNQKDIDYMRFNKGKTAKIQWMKPIEYLRMVYKNIFKKPLPKLEDLYKILPNSSEYNNMLKTGTKFDMPVLDLADKGQEGRNRALAALKYGLKKIPVLVVTKYDYKKELNMPKGMDLLWGHTLTWKEGTISIQLLVRDATENKLKKAVQDVKNDNIDGYQIMKYGN